MHKEKETAITVLTSDASIANLSCHFCAARSRWISKSIGSFLHPTATTGRKGQRMKIKVRYENEYQTLEVDTEEMWVKLSLESDKYITQKEKEVLIQDAFDEQFNKPEYNNWHKFDRHRGNLKRQFRKDDETEDESDGMETVPDYSDEINRTSRYEYEDVCQRIRQALGKKQDWADMFIAVRIDGMPVKDYALFCGDSENNITQKLKRAEKKLRVFFQNRQI